MAAGSNGGAMPQQMEEKINTNIVTLTRFLTEEQSKHKEATGDFTLVVPVHDTRTSAEKRTVCSATLCSSPSRASPTTSAALP